MAAPDRAKRWTIERAEGQDDGLQEAHVVYGWTDDRAGIISPSRVAVGELFFNGNEWLFIRLRQDGSQVMDGLHWIPTAPDAEAHDREARAHIIATHDPADAFLAEHDMEVKLRRDETRELAMLGAKMEARKWWRGGFWDGEEESTQIPAICDTCGNRYDYDANDACPRCGSAGIAGIVPT